METRPPTVTRILIAVGFAISCFALALFLWLAFGGAIPLKPESYRFTVPFDEATQLAVESDVRISGVSVGKVKAVELSDAGYAEATVEVEPRYAPMPADTRAILRQKTLLGETYVELSPGSSEGPSAARGRRPAAGAGLRVGAARRDLPRLRHPHSRRLPGLDAGTGRGVPGSRRRLLGRDREPRRRSPTSSSARCGCSTAQDAAVTRFVRDGGEVFAALSERQGQLRGLIENANDRLRDDRGAQRGPGDGVHDLPDLPARVADDPEPPRAVRDRHRSGGHGAAPDRARADAHGAGARALGARAGQLLRRPAAQHRRRPRRVRRRRDGCSTTTCPRC